MDHQKQESLNKYMQKFKHDYMRKMYYMEKNNICQNQLNVLSSADKIRVKKNKMIREFLSFLVTVILDFILIYQIHFPIFVIINILFTGGYSNENKIEYDREKKAFEKNFPNDLHLLKMSRKSLNKSISSIKQEIESIDYKMTDCCDQNEWDKIKMLENSTDSSFETIDELKHLSSCSAKPPISIEQLKNYRDLLLNYNNVLYTQNSSNDKINQKVKQ